MTGDPEAIRNSTKLETKCPKGHFCSVELVFHQSTKNKKKRSITTNLQNSFAFSSSRCYRSNFCIRYLVYKSQRMVSTRTGIGDGDGGGNGDSYSESVSY
jgi:hypothetical protein